MSKTLPVLRTSRLRLRPYATADREWFVSKFSIPVVLKHVDGALSIEAAEALFAGILEGTRARVFGKSHASGPRGLSSRAMAVQ